MVDNPNTATGPVYKGLAIGRDEQRDLLFATNFPPRDGRRPLTATEHDR